MTTQQYVFSLVVTASCGALILLLIMFGSTPASIGPVGVTGWFVLLLVEFSVGATLALFGTKTFLKLHEDQRRRLRYAWRQGWLIGGGLTGLLALMSLHQLGMKDILLLGLLLSIIEGYVRLRWP